MIVDTSALVAIVLDEPGADTLSEILLAASRPRMASPTLVELYAVLDNRSSPAQRRRLDALLELYGIEVEPFTAEHAEIAREAYREFGRGSGHPARLNLGDCFAYALAAATRDRLLFVGDDFARTDLRPAHEAAPPA
ncbi:VapC toxin family PIN domain ribonuclease [Cellulosimicrobium cellulans]|uniref:Ribonuclease VapC n=1 Tax=Cellulosimicrobium cellulans TaxID=1710 RepID=A0A1Y0HTH5_CELCE|nr:type II toxin-antitoxin system VapC family toxin [Cellulosimicrobium cellulans]ARU51451.1 VapC toxin family PIN domain ribonuclease [Cellulosimicrobium cellulans]